MENANKTPEKMTRAEAIEKLTMAVRATENPAEVTRIMKELIKLDPSLAATNKNDELPDNPLLMVEHLIKVCSLTPEEIRKKWGIGAVITPILHAFKLTHAEAINWLQRDMKNRHKKQKKDQKDESNTKAAGKNRRGS